MLCYSFLTDFHCYRLRPLTPPSGRISSNLDFVEGTSLQIDDVRTRLMNCRETMKSLYKSHPIHLLHCLLVQSAHSHIVSHSDRRLCRLCSELHRSTSYRCLEWRRATKAIRCYASSKEESSLTSPDSIFTCACPCSSLGTCGVFHSTAMELSVTFTIRTPVILISLKAGVCTSMNL